jgi:hypothetical protein
MDIVLVAGCLVMMRNLRRHQVLGDLVPGGLMEAPAR